MKVPYSRGLTPESTRQRSRWVTTRKAGCFMPIIRSASQYLVDVVSSFTERPLRPRRSPAVAVAAALH
eukprot:scaffold145_cov195-Alexandrium_tamarense.AAC.65